MQKSSQKRKIRVMYVEKEPKYMQIRKTLAKDAKEIKIMNEYSSSSPYLSSS